MENTGSAAVTEQWVRDVEGAAEGQNWPQAISLAGRALSLGLVHPRLFHVRAIGRERAAQLAGAIEDLTRAHALDPDDPGIANALSSCLVRVSRPSEAVALLDVEAAARPDIPETWFNLGAANQAAGNLKAAASAFQRAVALRPDYVPALAKLAVLAVHRGDAVEGAALARQVLARSPNDPEGRRALIESQIEGRQVTEAEAAARDWLSTPQLGPTGRMQALGLLGDALDLQGRAAEAFAAYAQSKAAFTAANAAAFRGLEQQPLADLLAAMRREFAALPHVPSEEATFDEPESPRTHVFLMGFMRSGTTLLEQALSLHPDVVTLEETEAMAEAGAARLGTPGAFAEIAAMDRGAVLANRARYWAAVRSAGVEPAGRVLVDKLPFNGIKLPLIRKLFPQARIVFAIRDPRDVVFSCFQKRLKPNSFAYEMRTLEGAARFYASYMALTAAYRAALHMPILDHRHEALVADVAASVREVCDFIGLDFRPEMVDFQSRAEAGVVMSQTSKQLRGGVSTKSLGRWRAYAEQLAPVQPILAPWVRAYGYEGD